MFEVWLQFSNGQHMAMVTPDERIADFYYRLFGESWAWKFCPKGAIPLFMCISVPDYDKPLSEREVLKHFVFDLQALPS